MLTSDTTIRAAGPADAAALASFGERTFRATFSPHNRAEDMDAYCSVTYTVERQLAQLLDPEHHFLLVERVGELIGYAHLRAGAAPACVTGADPMEILRFYVDRAWHGRGVAQTMMAATLCAARDRGARALYLGVWEHNRRAIAFYSSQGFRDVGSQTFLLGTDRQNDRIMERRLTP